jgi:serine/threonine protein kinase
LHQIMVNFSLGQAGMPSLPAQFTPAQVAQALGAEHVMHLGTGGFGDTWLLENGSDKKVAKILYEPKYPLALLEREVKGLLRVASPRVVRLLGVQQLVFSVGARIVLFFEYIDGRDVMTRIRGGDWPAEPEVLAFAAGLFEGLVALHTQEAVHRDLKPENIALRHSAWNEPVVLDLGLAKLLDEPSITTYPAVLGTVPYMAPEQLRGDRARKAADLWAAGVVLHLLLAREHPFYDHELLDQDTAVARLLEGPRPMPTGIGEPLRSLTRRLLSPKPHERGGAARALRELEVVRG